MSLFRKFSLRRSVLAALGLTVLATGAAGAQPRPSIPLDARGFQTTVAVQEYYQHQVSASPHTVTAPAPSRPEAEPRFVSITGPDGRVRTFQIEGPVTVVPTPTRVVHFGAR